MPDGTYPISVRPDDATHFEGWGTPDPEGAASSGHLLTRELAPTGVDFVVANF